MDGTLQESETIEFKHTLPHNLPMIAKTIVGIANSGGGYLILGVIDDSKKRVRIVGVDNVDDLNKTITQLLDDYTVGVQTTQHIYTVESKKNAIIRIEKVEPVAYYSRRDTSPARLIVYRRETANGSRIKDIAKKRNIILLFTSI